MEARKKLFPPLPIDATDEEEEARRLEMDALVHRPGRFIFHSEGVGDDGRPWTKERWIYDHELNETPMNSTTGKSNDQEAEKEDVANADDGTGNVLDTGNPVAAGLHRRPVAEPTNPVMPELPVPGIEPGPEIPVLANEPSAVSSVLEFPVPEKRKTITRALKTGKLAQFPVPEKGTETRRGRKPAGDQMTAEDGRTWYFVDGKPPRPDGYEPSPKGKRTFKDGTYVGYQFLKVCKCQHCNERSRPVAGYISPTSMRSLVKESRDQQIRELNARIANFHAVTEYPCEKCQRLFGKTRTGS